MIDVRPFASLGAVQIDWLNAHHHFSFGHYHDPKRMGVGPLRVWNDDTIKPKTGFDPHPHRDMEIITYVRKGAITHQDRLGNEGRTVAGDVQVMHAGTGIVHAEYNLEDEETQIFQIWINPDRAGHEPGWGAMSFPDKSSGSFTSLASGRPDDKASNILSIHQDAAVLGTKLKTGEEVTYSFNDGRQGYLVSTDADIEVNGAFAEARDGIHVLGEDKITVLALGDTDIVMVDVA
ncbi:pirin family protein [Roseibium sp.]|uniref:pirin family protein n=1 Tax=Roseibium sp. TaxID=1936156 RepID=UPI0032983506